tara:strand:+ start:188 stop:361 length:174 start_codon:yes stop_codon:yes gene_type:complete
MAMTRREKEEHDRLITEYLEKGGEITKCDTGAVTEGAVLSVWKKGPGRPKASDKKED